MTHLLIDWNSNTEKLTNELQVEVRGKIFTPIQFNGDKTVIGTAKIDYIIWEIESSPFEINQADLIIVE